MLCENRGKYMKILSLWQNHWASAAQVVGETIQWLSSQHISQLFTFLERCVFHIEYH